MKTRNSRVLGLCYLALALPFLASTATAQSVYVLYASDSKSQLKELKKSLSGRANVRGYNVKLLALADYSGKQKAVARINKADLVIILGDSALKPMKGSKFAPPVLVLNTTRKGVTSKGQLLYVVNGSTDLNKLGGNVKKVSADQKDELTKETIADSDVIVVESPLKTTECAEIVAAALLAG